MTDLRISPSKLPFPSTSGADSAIAGSRGKPWRPIVRTPSPIFGRRPDGSGHDGAEDDECILVRVPGPGPSHKYIALCPTGGAHAIVHAKGPSAALSEAKRSSDAPIVACEPALAELAATLGLDVRPLSKEQTAAVAFFSLLPSATARMSSTAAQTADLLRLMRACAELTRLAPWNGPFAGRLLEIRATGQGPDAHLALVLQRRGEEFGPGFALADPDLTLDGGPGPCVRIGAHFRYFVRLAPLPDYTLPPFRAAFGFTEFPVVGAADRCCEHESLTLDQVRMLTGAIECVTQIATSGSTHAIATVDRRRVVVAPHAHDALLGTPSGSA